MYMAIPKSRNLHLYNFKIPQQLFVFLSSLFQFLLSFYDVCPKNHQHHHQINQKLFCRQLLGKHATHHTLRMLHATLIITLYTCTNVFLFCKNTKFIIKIRFNKYWIFQMYVLNCNCLNEKSTKIMDHKLNIRSHQTIEKEIKNDNDENV